MSIRLDVLDYRPSVKVIGIGEKGYDVAKRIFLDGIKYVEVIGFNNDYKEEELKTACKRSDLVFVVYKHNDIINTTFHKDGKPERSYTFDDVLPIFTEFTGNTLIFGVIISDDNPKPNDHEKFFTHTLNVRVENEDDVSLFINSITDVTQVSFGSREICIDFADFWQMSEICKEYAFFSVAKTGDDSIEVASSKAVELLKEHKLTGSKCIYFNVALGKDIHCYASIDEATSPIMKAMGKDCYILYSELELTEDFPIDGVLISMMVSLK